jgi:hypothetical protein
MRGDDDDVQGDGTAGGPLAEGLGETEAPGASSSADDTYGDAGDTYGSDTYGDDGDGSDTTSGDTSTDDTYGADSYGTDTYGDADATTDGDGTFGDGDGTTDADVLDDTADADVVDVTVDGGADGTELLTESESPIDGIRYVLDELHEALFGEEDATVGEAAATGFENDPADVVTETDLDFNGDGVADRADLDEVTSSFDFDAD